MQFNTEGNTTHVTLDKEERYGMSIHEQLQFLKAAYPDYDVMHAKRTEDGWDITRLDAISKEHPLFGYTSQDDLNKAFDKRKLHAAKRTLEHAKTHRQGGLLTGEQTALNNITKALEN